MRWQGTVPAALLILFLAGCSTTTANENPAPPKEPNVLQPNKPPTVTPQSDEERLFAFFVKYYQSRDNGDTQTIIAMTGGTYQNRALQTLAADRGAAFAVINSFGTRDRITVVRQRNAVESGVTFKVEPTGDTYRIVDMVDPQSGRWLTEHPATAPFPKEMQAGLDQFLQGFYQARSFDGPLTDEQRSKLFSLTRDPYNPYLANLLRNPLNASERFSVDSTTVAQWVPEGSGQSGTAEVIIRRTMTTRGMDGRPATNKGEARLRIQRLKLEDGTVGWRVVDGFLADEGAWVSTLGWKGLLTAA